MAGVKGGWVMRINNLIFDVVNISSEVGGDLYYYCIVYLFLYNLNFEINVWFSKPSDIIKGKITVLPNNWIATILYI